MRGSLHGAAVVGLSTNTPVGPSAIANLYYGTECSKIDDKKSKMLLSCYLCISYVYYHVVTHLLSILLHIYPQHYFTHV